MSPITGLLIGAYLLASLVAWGLHELAHYAVHSLHAETVDIGVTRWGPYTESTYSSTAPTYAIRLGSIAPTLIYGPIVLLGIMGYVWLFPLPQLDPVEWTFVSVPLLILVVPTAADIHGCVYAHQVA